ncbi:MAG: AMP-binding protein [Gammaproteobacteria bacterium]
MIDLSRWIDKHASFQAAKPALIFEGRPITYRELSTRVRQTARMLKNELDIEPGDRVAYLGKNSPELLILFFACTRIGAIFLPLNWRLATPELVLILRDAGARALVAEVDFRAAAEAIHSNLPGCRLLASRFESSRPNSPWLSLEALLEGAEGEDRNDAVSTDDPALLVYSATPEGRPKGVVVSQQALFYNTLNTLHMHDMHGSDVVLTVLPLFHIGGLCIQTLPALYVGATVVLHSQFDAAEVLACIRAERPTLLVLVATAMRAMTRQEDWSRTDISCLRMVTVGASPVPRRLIDAFHARKVPVAQVYGMSEIGPVSVYQRAEDALLTVGSVGRPGMYNEVRIAGPQDEALPAGGIGDILVKGPNVMSGYWNDEEATRKVFRDGWFVTGDIGYFDGNGSLWLTDRREEAVVSGGETLYPAELERLLEGMPEVEAAAVVGVADEYWGEVPVAILVPRPGAQLGTDEVKAYLNGRIGRYKHPRRILLVGQLPTDSNGNVDRAALRRMARAA